MNTMTAIKLHAFGEPDCLCPSQMDRPQPSMGEVLIRVEAAGVNRPDIMQRKGLYPPPPGASDILGLEVAGTVAAVGEQVSSPQVGDDVCALVTGGGYAEYCIAAAPLCLPIPRGLNYIQAASLPETFFTVWTNVFERGKLQARDSILIHGGTSGIGVAAIQLARCFGSKVFATAGTEEKCRFCTDLGAQAINYHEQDFAASILELTDNRGVDVILDMVGGDYLQRNLSCLAMEGRLVQIAVMNGPKANINLPTIMLKRLTLTGSTLRPRSVDEKARIARALLAQVWPLLESGEIKPIVHAVFKLEKAADAHSLMESGRHIGKIILTTGS